MAKLAWNATQKRKYETGTKKAVLFTQQSTGEYDKGVAWEGFIGVNEQPESSEPKKLYANDDKYGELMGKEEFKATLEAYSYPTEFAKCNGEVAVTSGAKLGGPSGVYVGQQKRMPFGLAYVTTVGNDTEGLDYGYKLHLVYGLLAQAPERAYKTISDSPEAITFSWKVTSTPAAVTKIAGVSAASTIIIDSTECDSEKLKAITDKIWGTDMGESTMLLPDEVYDILNPGA